MAESSGSKDATQPSTDPRPLKSENKPAIVNEHEDGSENEVDEVDHDRGIVVNASDMTSDMLPKKKSKKRKSKRSAAQRGLNKPTGFEDFHADAPLTPEQFEEIREAFNSEIPFVDRILKAIQRFERTRKLSPERRNVFYKYLAYGGVDIGPNMFVGAQDTTEMSKDEVTTAMAQASISEDTKQSILNPKQDHTEDSDSANEPSKLHSAEHMAKYVVDFEGTMRSFLSRRAPAVFVLDTQEDVALVTTTLERFMDYLLQNDVCPEYKTEVLRTRDLCRTARQDLWSCVHAQRQFPGDFNTACSMLFTGASSQAPWKDSETKAVTPQAATQIIGFAIAGAATEQVYKSYLSITTGDSQGQGFEITNTVSGHGFEVTKIVLPTQECRDLYHENTADFHPVGTVYAKFFANPDAPPEDLTPAERAAFNSNHDHVDLYDQASTEYTFFVESSPSLDLLGLLRVGTRVEATIYTLNCGVHFFDRVLRIFPPFDLWIVNEMMVGWKEPKWIEGAGAIDYARLEAEREDKNGTDPEKSAAAVEDTGVADRQDIGDADIQSSTDLNGGDHGNGNDDDDPY